MPVLHLDRLVRAVRQGVRDHAPTAELIVFGHLAEGNLHVPGIDKTKPPEDNPPL